MHYAAQRKVCMKWSDNLAYAIGLIASDGCLNKDRRHILFTSADKELVEDFKRALKIKNKIYRSGRGGEAIKKYYSIQFGDVVFYEFLNSIGLTPAKSKTIKKVEIPKKYLSGFIRGLFDGDGSFYSFYDKRWPTSFCYKISFASASPSFVCWLKEKFALCFGVKGYFHKGMGVLNLEYTKADSRSIIRVMYRRRNILFLKRKRDKIKAALEHDATLHPDQAHYAAVA